MNNIKDLTKWARSITALRNELRLSSARQLTAQQLARAKELKINNFINPRLFSKKQLISFLFDLEVAIWWEIEDLKKGLTNPAKNSKK